MDIMGKIQSKVGSTSDLLGSLGDKMGPMLTDYKNATKKIEALGFRVGKMTLGMGLLPVVHTSLIGEVASIDVARLTAMQEENKQDELLVTVLKALILAKQIHSRVESTLKSMTMHITLGIPPGVSVEFT